MFQSDKVKMIFAKMSGLFLQIVLVFAGKTSFAALEV